jgi:hypothetical protein
MNDQSTRPLIQTSDMQDIQPRAPYMAQSQPQARRARGSKRSTTKGVKLFITAASIAATIGGWTAISAAGTPTQAAAGAAAGGDPNVGNLFGDQSLPNQGQVNPPSGTVPQLPQNGFFGQGDDGSQNQPRSFGRRHRDFGSFGFPQQNSGNGQQGTQGTQGQQQNPGFFGPMTTTHSSR